MKKGIIVLLIAVLVAGFAFADGKAGEAKYTGSATISYDYNLDNKATGIVNANSLKYNFTFEFNSAKGESAGSGNLYAEIAATAKLELVAKNAKATGELTPKATLKLTKANIIAGDVTIDILGPSGFYSYASFYAENADGDPAEDVANDNILDDLDLGNHGFRVIYKDFEVSFAFYHHVDTEAATDDTWGFNDPVDGANVTWVLESPGTPAVTEKYTNLYAGFQTPAFKIVDGLTLTAGGNYYFAKADDVDMYMMIVGGGFGVDYAPEDSKVSASFGYDIEALIVKDADDVLLPMEISASATYDFISAYAYFGTLNKFDSTADFLAAKVEADYAVNDALSVGGYGEILWLEIIGEGKPEFRFGASATYKAEKFGVKATADAWLKPVGDEYKLKGGKYYDGTKCPGLGFTVDVYSTAVIDNATVGVKWTGSDFAPNAKDEPTALGKISAYCKVEF